VWLVFWLYLEGKDEAMKGAMKGGNIIRLARLNIWRIVIFADTALYYDAW
jgi:hypothetical protein